jgi:hypothetical protein
MYCIKDKQIDYILSDIRARGVEMEDLQYNLLDHICCLIEQNLEENGDFEGFYKKTIPKFYKHELWEIEEETITLLTFKNYYTMKKIMLVSGTISAALLSVGILFKFMHWPGASIMLVLGIGLASLLFLPLLFTLKIKEKQQSKDKLILGIGMLAAISMSLGILFKIMHWPGANIMGMGAVLTMMFIFVPIYFFSGIRNPETKVNTIVSTLVFILGCGLFLTLINSRPSASIEKTNVIANLNMQNSYEFVLNQNEATFAVISKDSSKKLSCEELHAKTSKICNSIETLKLKLANATIDGNMQKLDYNNIPDGNNWDVSTQILFNNESRPNADLVNLKKDLSDFNAFAKEKHNLKMDMLIKLGEQLNSKNELSSWEIANFYYTPISIILRNLTQIQLDVLAMDANCMAVN